MLCLRYTNLSTLFLCLLTLTALSSANPVSARAPPRPNEDIKWFEQKIDHALDNSGTFKQRYKVVADYYKPGGPILFVHSPQTEIYEMWSFDFMDYARELGGLVTTLEHRYFGKSFPEDFNAEDPDYAPVTLENYVQDCVTFINWLKKQHGAEDSKVFNTGGML
jgi:lysosomal Pro-X carboxypeptidase